MSTQSDLVSALLAVFAVVAGAILLLMASTWMLSRRHRRRRYQDTAAARTLTMGDLVSVDKLADRFRADAMRRRQAVWQDQAARERDRARLRENPGSGEATPGNRTAGDKGF